MIKLALIGPHWKAQLDQNPHELRRIEVVSLSDDLDGFDRSALPHVVALDLDALGPQPSKEVEQLFSVLNVELMIIRYDYARREVLHSLQDPRIRLLQGSVSLASLKSQFMSLIVRDILNLGSDDRPSSEPSRRKDRACPRCGAPLISGTAAL